VYLDHGMSFVLASEVSANEIPSQMDARQ
jgi:hypothetical protein